MIFRLAGQKRHTNTPDYCNFVLKKRVDYDQHRRRKSFAFDIDPSRSNDAAIADQGLN